MQIRQYLYEMAAWHADWVYIQYNDNYIEVYKWEGEDLRKSDNVDLNGLAVKKATATYDKECNMTTVMLYVDADGRKRW